MGLIIHVDGGSRGNPGPSGAGVVIESEAGELLFEAAYFLGHQTNNAAEYHALIRALGRAQQCEADRLTVYSDSELLVRQVTGEYDVKSPKLGQLYQQVQMVLLKMPGWSIRHVKREENRRADELANLAMDERRNVVVFDRDDCGHSEQAAAGSFPSPAIVPADGPASQPADRGPGVTPPSATDRAVRVVVAQGPEADECPAGECSPEEFTVRSALPAELCVHAAHALLPTLLAMLNTDAQEFAAIPTLTVRCGRLGCGAAFQLSPVSSSNGHSGNGDE